MSFDESPRDSPLRSPNLSPLGSPRGDHRSSQAPSVQGGGEGVHVPVQLFDIQTLQEVLEKALEPIVDNQNKVFFFLGFLKL